MLNEMYGERGTGTKKSMKMEEVFVQYLSRHGTDFSYIRSDPGFKDFSDAQLFNMYVEYINSKGKFVNKIGRESKVAKIEKIVGREAKDSLEFDVGDGAGRGVIEYRYRAQALIEGRKQVQAVVDLRMDDFRLPFLLKDFELHLKQQLNYVEEIYSTLEMIGAISSRFLEDCTHHECDSHNMTEMAKPEADVLLCAQAVPGDHADVKRVLEQVPKSSMDREKANERSMGVAQPMESSLADHTFDSLDGQPACNTCEESGNAIPPHTSRSGKAQPSHANKESDGGMESMIDYPTSENVHADSNVELGSGSIPSSAQPGHVCDGNHVIQCSKSRSAEECPSNMPMVLKADILSKYDDYLGDFSEDLLDMQLPVPKTSTYNPLEPQAKRIKTNSGPETAATARRPSAEKDASRGCTNELGGSARSLTSRAGEPQQSILSMRKRNRNRVMMRPSSSANSVSAGISHERATSTGCTVLQGSGDEDPTKTSGVACSSDLKENPRDNKGADPQKQKEDKCRPPFE